MRQTGINQPAKETLVMLVLIVIATLSIVAIASTVIASSRDGYRRVPVAQR